MAKGASLNSSAVPFAQSNMRSFGSSGQIQNPQILHPSGNPVLPDQRKYHDQQYEQPELQRPQQSMQQLSVSHSHVRQGQQHIQSIQGRLGGGAPAKFELQMISDHIGPHQQFNSLQNLGPVELEQKQNQVGTGVGPVRLEHQHSDDALQKQKEQQQFLQWSMQSSLAAYAQLNPYQQHILQQQKLLKALPQQGPQLQQQCFQQNVPIRSIVRPVYEPGSCAQRLTQYMYQQKNRPTDNCIDFWIKFVAEFFSPNARKRWCFSLYQNSSQVYGAFNQDIWNCEICNCKPGRGFETTVEALPRLFKLKYDSGTLEELLHVDMPREYQNASGHIILEYAKATKESVFEHLRVEHDGQLRIVFSPDLKICSWEFCARSHEVLIPRRSIMPQVSELEVAARNYQICALNASSNHVSAQDLEMSCKLFGESACQLQKALDVPVLLTKLGYMQNYARGLQISDTACRMKGLIDYSLETGKGPMESHANFLKQGFGNSSQKPVEKQQNIGQNMNGHQANAVQSSASNDILSRSSHGMMPTCSSATAVDKFPHQNFKNSWQENQKNIPNSPCVETPVQIPSTRSSTMSPVQGNPSSPFLSPPPYASNNLIHTSQSSLPSRAANNDIGAVNSPAQIHLQSPSLLNEADQNEFQIYVEKIKQETASSSESGDAGSTSVLIPWGIK